MFMVRDFAFTFSISLAETTLPASAAIVGLGAPVNIDHNHHNLSGTVLQRPELQSVKENSQLWLHFTRIHVETHLQYIH